MSTQNGRPGQTANSVNPTIGYGVGGMPQHPLASPKTQHITLPSAAPLSPGAHIPQTGANNTPTPIGTPPRFTGTGRL